ncbi:hypothetical protein PRBRB14_24090 [Hallella multisaccharivorax DSM 17128]|uniref:beta-N-acetylhexosaminidase n=1 Tax=Hallella multisaccharivorax DSM 17128 TaxID=688246 RepID=F8N6C7_9BACT|nr:family 20 glycosylhydrolase [Hallella multisaccharivorax]EGN57232.1 Beta-N-acetylhexosaminidase [Hallella multisaccharivorax DSM 17128]GJG31530.1 hypothetical protein PRBRB14_24090 [Hallella multisaccharivorax DSM 17128]
MKKHIEILIFLFALSITACATEIDIIPQPQKLKVQNGMFIIDEMTWISAPSDRDYQRVASFLKDRLSKGAGISVRMVNDRAKGSGITFSRVNGLGKEAYRLKVTASGIVIESSQANGAFYGLQTLYQLMSPEIYGNKRAAKPCMVKCCGIEDSPRFSWRGLQLDVCSHFFGPDGIKRYLDLIAMHKGNVFHWHLTEDQGWRIQIKRYPLLTEKGSIRKETVVGTYKSKIYDGKPYGGFYTQDEIRSIVKYAADRFITIIPEIEMPGHSLAAVSCYPELSCQLEDKYEVGTRWGIYRQVYCPKENTFKFLENVLGEIFALFPSKIIHIGGDECPKSSWKKCPHCQALIKKLGLKDEFGLQSYFIQRIEKYANSKGRTIIGWDELLQGGLAPNAMVMSWLGEESGIKAAKMHHKVVMTPYTKYYLDYYQANPATEQLCQDRETNLRTMYDYNPLPDTLSEEERQYIVGVQGCVWTEYIPDMRRVEYMAFPRACAILETAWTKSSKDWQAFTRRLEYHMNRLNVLNVNYCRAFYDVEITAHDDDRWDKVITMTVDCPDVVIRFTTDGSEPSMQSPAYAIPFTINQAQVVKARAFRNGQPLGKTVSKGF